MSPRRVPRRRDVVLAAAVAVISQVELLVGPSSVTPYPVGTAALVLAVAVPVVWRSRYPVASVLLSSAAYALIPLLTAPVELFVAGVVVFLLHPFTLATLAPTWRSAVGSGLVLLVLVGLQGFWDDRYGSLGAVLANVSFAVLGFAAGAVVRTVEQRSARGIALVEAAAVEAARTQRAEMARDLHDVVAHALSVVTVQAGGARAVLGTDPALAARALEDIQAVSRRAMVDMRHLLDLLRDPVPGEGGPVRRPGLDRLEELVEPLRGAGIQIDVVREGSPVPVSPGTETTAVRVVQEALTNVLKHSRSRRAQLSVRWQPTALELGVRDDGQGSAGAPAGHGLIGMRERVDLLGGRLHAGPGATGGWEVRAWLPLDVAGGPG